MNWMECIEQVRFDKAEEERKKRVSDEAFVLMRAEQVREAMTCLGFEVISPVEDKESYKRVYGYFRFGDNGRVRMDIEIDKEDGIGGRYRIVLNEEKRILPAWYLKAYARKVYEESQKDSIVNDSLEMLVLAMKVRMCGICGVEYEDVMHKMLG